MLSVFDVAKYILQMDTNGMTTMKLQKLCYYCQAYSLGWTNEKLFYEDIYAWKNGPVCRTLFNAHKGIFLIYLSDHLALHLMLRVMLKLLLIRYLMR